VNEVRHLTTTRTRCRVRATVAGPHAA